MPQRVIDRRNNEIPVYIFTGFLGSGKTSFIQDTLNTPEFDDDKKTLLIVCEDGEIEYEPEKFAAPDVTIEVIEDAEDLNHDTLYAFDQNAKYDRIMVEYNGMWLMEDFFASMPRNWAIAQEMCFMDATTFLMYNKNMRQLTFNKMQTAELVVFNRCERGFDKIPFHREVRIANRYSMILYEYGPYEVEIDDIPDPLPYDKNQPQIEIKDEWYAEWYRDINENENDYEGKILTFKARVALAEELPTGKFAVGRHVMTCCVEDIQFAGLMCVYSGPREFKTGDWVKVKAKVRNEYEEAYKEKGPVLYARSIEATEAPDPEVAGF